MELKLTEDFRKNRNPNQKKVMAILTKKRTSWYFLIRMPNNEKIFYPCDTQNERVALIRTGKIDHLVTDFKSGKLTKDEFMNEVSKIY